VEFSKKPAQTLAFFCFSVLNISVKTPKISEKPRAFAAGIPAKSCANNAVYHA
jgi:hypothetical protein